MAVNTQEIMQCLLMNAHQNSPAITLHQMHKRKSIKRANYCCFSWGSFVVYVMLLSFPP